MAEQISNAFLVGDSGRIPDAERFRRIEGMPPELKLLCGNRYEHFKPTPETARIGEFRLRIFRWTYTTRPAE